MRKITKPTIKVNQVLIDCIDNMELLDLKTELTNSASIFADEEKEFEIKKQNNCLHELIKHKVISSTINNKVLKKLYSDRMVSKNNKGRTYYDSIYLSAPNGKCPYCSQRIVRTLDHYLPKSKFPLLSITPINLVPSCSDCNKDKLVDIPLRGEEETLHPYYDDVETESWLKMKIISYKPFEIEFYTFPPLDWDNMLRNRIEFHFKSYRINELYCVHAKEEFENIRFTITDLYQKLGSLELKNHLIDSFKSREHVNKNSWQTAFYNTISQDISFINGAFQ